MRYLLIFTSFLTVKCAQSSIDDTKVQFIEENLDTFENNSLSFESLAKISSRSFSDTDSTTNSYRLALDLNSLVNLEENIHCKKEYKPNSFGKWSYIPSIPWFAEFDLKEKSPDERYITKDLDNALIEENSSFKEKFSHDNLWDYFVDKEYITSSGRVLIGKPDEITFADFKTQMSSLKNSNKKFDNIIDSLIDFIKTISENNLEDYMGNSNNNLSSDHERSYGALLNIKCLFLSDAGSESIAYSAQLLDQKKQEQEQEQENNLKLAVDIKTTDFSVDIKEHSSKNILYGLAFCNGCEQSEENTNYYSVLFYFQKNTKDIEMFFEYIFLTKNSDSTKTKDNRRTRLYAKIIFDNIDFESSSISTLIQKISEKKDTEIKFQPKTIERNAIFSILWGQGSDCEDCRNISNYSISQELSSTKDNNTTIIGKLGSYYEYKNNDITVTDQVREGTIDSDLEITNNNKCFLIPQDSDGSNQDVSTLNSWYKQTKENIETDLDYMSKLKASLTSTNLSTCI
jgi:hypothetical protein